MDLNYLLHRHQLSLFMAENAASEQARLAHRQLAEAYAAQIASLRFERPPEMAA
jgi:hypothetical protein